MGGAPHSTRRYNYYRQLVGRGLASDVDEPQGSPGAHCLHMNYEMVNITII